MVRCRLEEAITVRRERNWTLEGLEREKGEEEEEEERGRRRKFRNFESWAIVEAFLSEEGFRLSHNKTLPPPTLPLLLPTPSFFLLSVSLLYIILVYNKKNRILL